MVHRLGGRDRSRAAPPSARRSGGDRRAGRSRVIMPTRGRGSPTGVNGAPRQAGQARSSQPLGPASAPPLFLAWTPSRIHPEVRRRGHVRSSGSSYGSQRWGNGAPGGRRWWGSTRRLDDQVVDLASDLALSAPGISLWPCPRRSAWPPPRASAGGSASPPGRSDAGRRWPGGRRDRAMPGARSDEAAVATPRSASSLPPRSGGARRPARR